MTNETFRILLEAKNPEKGISGLTGSDAGQDLFGQWDIDVSCERIGRRGRSVTYSAADDSGLLSAVGPPARMVQAVLQRRLISIMSPATFAELATGVHRSTRRPAFARAGINLAILGLPGSTRNVFLVGAEHGTMANQRRKRKPLTQSHFRT